MITYKSPEEIKILREGGKILALVLKMLAPEVQVGRTPKELDVLAETIMREHGAKPSFKGYRPEGAARAYPAATCISVNDVIVHGIPDARAFRDGDMVKLDIGVNYKGLLTDGATTVGVGTLEPHARRLMEVTKKALKAGIKAAKLGRTTGDIGYAISKVAEGAGFKVIKILTGHGVGYGVHEDPVIYNYGSRGKGVKLEEGMVIAIEPMFSISSDDAIQLKDDSYVTHDGSLAAHFEHTVAITKRGTIIIT